MSLSESPNPVRDSRRPRLRRYAALGAALALAAPLGAAQAQPDQSKVPGKTFAAYRYHWYPVRWMDHFNGPLSRFWKPQGRGVVRTQHGMLTLMSTRHGSVGVTLQRHAHDRGRWEIRFRGKRRERGHADYTLAAELIPAGAAAYHCGAQNISLASYRPGRHRAGFYIRTLPDNAFTRMKRHLNLRNDYWHTWAVEVTPRRISWFVDGYVRATERRPAALSGIPLTIRFQLQDQPGRTMNASRLQVDTVRYFTLKSPNRKSVKAPAPTRRRYAGAC